MAGFDDFFKSIVGQESGGNYRAVNRDSGALGFAQVMPSNVGAWSREILGYAVTPSQFLNSPDLQNAIVRGKLKKYYDQYGARGAASAWYSGDPHLADDTRSQNGYPSIKSYVDQVTARMGGDYGVTAGSVTDNRATQTSLADLYAPKQAEQVDALSGADVSGLGLKQVDGMGLDANTGGVGTEAPKVTAPAAETGGGKRTAGEVAADRGQVIADLQRQGNQGRRGSVIDLAEQYLGTPYVWGGSQPGGFDCSGLIQYAMKQAGIDVPRVSWDQLAMGQRTDVKNLRPGDLVGFHDGSHVALYLGNNQILEAPRTGLNVRIRSLGSGSFDQSAFGVSLDSLYK
jgi:cell wall-associated NlpC family hydrolase